MRVGRGAGRRKRRGVQGREVGYGTHLFHALQEGCAHVFVCVRALVCVCVYVCVCACPCVCVSVRV